MNMIIMKKRHIGLAKAFWLLEVIVQLGE